LLLFILSSATMAQRVWVVDSESNEPLEGVLIYGDDPESFVLTDKSGSVAVDALLDRKRLHFQLMGYFDQVVNITVLEKNNFRVSLKTSLLDLAQTVVSASRWRQSGLDVPQKISVLSTDDLTIRNPSNTADWLGSSGDVYIQKSQQGGGSPMIRGFSANRLLYAVDGVRMNTAIFRSGNLQNVISLDPFSIASTEVLFGPGSVMYGSDAIGGVMAFETMNPDFSESDPDFSGNLISRFATVNQEMTFHADLNYSQKNWAFLTSVTHADYGDLKMGSLGPDSYLRNSYQTEEGQAENPNPKLQVNSGYSQLNLMQKVKHRTKEGTEFDYGFHFSKTGNIPRYDRLIEENPYNSLRFATWKYGPQVWMMNNLGITKESESKLYDQVKFKLAHQYFEESRINRRMGSAEQFTRTEKVNALSANLDLIKHFGSEDFLNYGAELVYNKVNSSGIVQYLDNSQQSPASARYPNSGWFSAGLYSSYHFHLSEKIQLQSGARFNFILLNADFSENQEFFPLPFSNSQNRFGSLTGSLGLIFQPTSSWSISPLLSSGFRAPNVDDIGKIFDSEPGAVLVPNLGLKPEYAYNSEINISKNVNSLLKLNISGFYTYLTDAMVRRPFSIDGETVLEYEGQPSQILAIQNASSAEVYGFQAGLELKLSDRLLFSSKYNWQRGFEKMENAERSPSRHAAPAFGISRLRYLKEKIKIELSSSYNAAVPFARMPVEESNKPQLYAEDEAGNPFSPEWLIVDLRATYNISSWLEVMGGVENIADIRYRPYSSGLAAPGRNFAFSVKGSF